MSEHPDVTLIRKGYAAFNSADVATLSELIAGDAVQHMPGDNEFAGDHKGLENILALYGKLAERSNGTYRVEIESAFADGAGRVVIVHRQLAERDGKQLDSRQALIFTIVANLIVDLHDTTEDLSVDDAFWA